MAINRKTMTNWVEDALQSHNGSATIFQVCKRVWEDHGDEITAAGDMFYKWQYEIRWAGDMLRKDGVIRSATDSPRGVWELTTSRISPPVISCSA